MMIKKLLNWFTYQRKTIIKPDGKIIIEPKFSPSRRSFGMDAIAGFKDMEYKIKTNYPEYEKYKIGKPRRHIAINRVFWFVLIISVIIYSCYLTTNPEGEYSIFVNGAEQQYYESCKKHNTCSDDVAEILRQVGTLKVKFFDSYILRSGNEVNAGVLNSLDKDYIMYIAGFPPSEQKKLAEKLTKGELVTDAGAVKINVIGGTEEQTKQVKKVLGYIELVKPYGHKYLENVLTIEIINNEGINLCGRASAHENKIQINFRQQCNVYNNDPKELVGLVINEACKVFLTNEFLIKNNYDKYKTCIAVETFCEKESPGVIFHWENQEEYLKEMCGENR